jgi:Mrp family chromosome partitioning ATPase
MDRNYSEHRASTRGLIRQFSDRRRGKSDSRSPWLHYRERVSTREWMTSSRVRFIVGKGGVGRSTVAAAVALSGPVKA